MDELAGHTFDRECPRCPGGHGGAGRCDHARYGRTRLRFVRRHLEAFRAAYFNPNPSAAEHELERLRRECATLPPRHDCTCWSTHCRACARLNDQRPRGADVAISIGRSSLVNAPMPDVELMDLADAVSNTALSVRAIARWLNERQGW